PILVRDGLMDLERELALKWGDGKKLRGERQLRTATQVYANLCLLYLLQVVIPPYVQYGCGDPTSFGLKNWLTKLDGVVAARGGAQEGSYFVNFVQLATRWALSTSAGEQGALHEEIRALLDDGSIIPYDRRKLVDFLPEAHRRHPGSSKL